MSRLGRFLRSLPCRMGLRPHVWTFWTRLNDGDKLGWLWPTPKILIVERCAHQPWCRAVRSYEYQTLVPSSFVDEMLAALSRPNPYAALHRGWVLAWAAPTSPSRKAPDAESASAPNGAGR